MSSPAAGTRPFPWTIYWAIFAMIFVIANLPIVTTVVAAAVTAGSGCTINESVLNPCIIDGQDWGYWLQFGGMSFLYLFVTWPAAFVLLVVWLIVLLIHSTTRRRVMA
jgi:hypothetical protein